MSLCPNYGEKILTHFKGEYDAAYIILQPFTSYLEKDKNLFTGENWPKRDECIKKLEPVTWNSIVNKFSFKDIKQLNYALLSYINAINNKDDYLSNKIGLIRDKNNILEPENGEFDDFLYNNILNIINDEGYQNVIVDDECSDNPTEITIKDARKTEKYSWPNYKNIYSPDKKLLFTIHWDSYFVIFCGEKEIIDKYIYNYSLEGFWCTDETEILWHDYNVKT